MFREVSIGRGGTCEVYIGQLVPSSSTSTAQIAPAESSNASVVPSSTSNSTDNFAEKHSPSHPALLSTCPDVRSPLVALKYVSKHQSSNSDNPFASPSTDVKIAIKRLQHEQRILSRLDHPGVCKLFGSFCDDTCAISIQRIYPYGSLASHLRAHARRLLPMSIVREYMREMVVILHYLHSEQHVAHRDISARNFVLDKQGHLVLIDFGMANVESLISSSSSVPARADFAPFIGKQDGEGSLYYLAPERLGFKSSPLTASKVAADFDATSASSSSSDFASDWWALGVILHEMLLGFLPFDGRDNGEIQAAIQQYSEMQFEIGVECQTSSNAPNSMSEDDGPQNPTRYLLPQSTLQRLDCGGPIAVRGTDSNLSILSHLLHPDPSLRWGDAQLSQLQAHPFFSDLNTQWPQTQQQALTHWHSAAANACATNLGAFASLECAKEFEAVDSKSLELA